MVHLEVLLDQEDPLDPLHQELKDLPVQGHQVCQVVLQDHQVTQVVLQGHQVNQVGQE